MGKFLIEPHFRLQEWVAEEKRYFAQEGLDYEFNELIRATDGQHHMTPDKVGAYQSIEKGRESAVTCACHWTVNVAASAGHTKIYGDAYSIAPSAIFVPAQSDVRNPEDLAGIPISVGFQSGSHYSTIQALERFLEPEQMELSFGDGMLFGRMQRMIDGDLPAVSLFSGPYYFAEQLGFRKIIDTTFMIAGSISANARPDDVRRYYKALQRAQGDIDLRPELYTHYYLKEFPDKFHGQMDTRRWGPGERIVFQTYSKAMFEDSFNWIKQRSIFPESTMGTGRYEDAVTSFASP